MFAFVGNISVMLGGDRVERRNATFFQIIFYRNQFQGLVHKDLGSLCHQGVCVWSLMEGAIVSVEKLHIM